MLCVSGRAILEALVAGERDPERLADLTVRQVRAKIPQLVEALDGNFTPHHAFMVRHYLDQIDHLNATVAMFDVRIAELLAAQERDLNLLDTIPGISRLAAEIVIAETGGDMAQFAAAHHLTPPGSESAPGRASPPA
ncbi:hypothetical protein [Streptomyces sp. NPDC090080]|uniref:hypothetical protein n=1 Tax=Streptomyces sp. NPDC090080 TaxID=3365939 RepID=UPI0037F5F41F